MIKTRSPKCLWDHCLELEAYVRSCTSNDIYMTAGQVSETIMTGNTAIISHIAEFGWYDWVMFHNSQPSFPDDKLILGCYLGPVIDTGSALTAKILKSNGWPWCPWLVHSKLFIASRPWLAQSKLSFHASVYCCIAF